MDYLQYKKEKEAERDLQDTVLNLVINGLPSILGWSIVGVSLLVVF